MDFNWSKLLWATIADGTAVASTNSETSLLTGLVEQPRMIGGFWAGPKRIGRTVHLMCAGIFSNTGTPTLTFQVRIDTTGGPATLSGNSVAVSAAITTQSGVTNVCWQMDLWMTLRAGGIGTNNATVDAWGWVKSPAGFASPFEYPMLPAIGSPTTWTMTFDGTLVQYINPSVTWSANSASNTIKLKACTFEGWDG